MFGFMKNIGGVTRKVVWNSIVLLNDNLLEQKFENVNRDEVGNEEPLGDDNNGKEEEQKTLSYEDFNHSLVVTNFLLGLREKHNQRWRTQQKIWGSASQSILNVDSQYNYQRSIYVDSEADFWAPKVSP